MEGGVIPASFTVIIGNRARNAGSNWSRNRASEVAFRPPIQVSIVHGGSDRLAGCAVSPTSWPHAVIRALERASSRSRRLGKHCFTA